MIMMKVTIKISCKKRWIIEIAIFVLQARQRLNDKLHGQGRENAVQGQ